MSPSSLTSPAAEAAEVYPTPLDALLALRRENPGLPPAALMIPPRPDGEVLVQPDGPAALEAWRVALGWPESALRLVAHLGHLTARGEWRGQQLMLLAHGLRFAECEASEECPAHRAGRPCPTHGPAPVAPIAGAGVSR